MFSSERKEKKMKSSTAQIAALLALAAISQFAYAAEQRPNQPAMKIAYYAPSAYPVKPLKKSVVHAPQASTAPMAAATPAAQGEATPIGLEVRTLDINEQFTRSSCCP
jgi:hypothetical protein